MSLNADRGLEPAGTHQARGPDAKVKDRHLLHQLQSAADLGNSGFGVQAASKVAAVAQRRGPCFQPLQGLLQGHV